MDHADLAARAQAILRGFRQCDENDCTALHAFGCLDANSGPNRVRLVREWQRLENDLAEAKLTPSDLLNPEELRYLLATIRSEREVAKSRQVQDPLRDWFLAYGENLLERLQRNKRPERLGVPLELWP